MHVSVDLTRQTATLEDADDLDRLHVQVAGGEDLDRVAEVLAPLGRIEGDHAYLDIDALRRAAGRTDPGWSSRFDAMVDVARSNGWLDEAGTSIQAHLRMEG